MDLTRVDVIPAPVGVGLSFVESAWHRIRTELECERATAMLADLLDREPCWDDLHVLASLRSVELDQTGRLMRLMATRRVSSFLDGQTVRDIVDLAGEAGAADVMGQRTTRHEVGLAIGRTKDQTEFLIGTYRRLVADFPDFVAALTAGQISLGHCYAMHEETLVVTDPAVLATIAAKALPFAQAHSVTKFRTCVKRLIQRHDPDAAARRRQARLARRVSFSNLGDGVSAMTVVARTEDVDAIRESIDDAARSLVAADRAHAEAEADAAAAAAAAAGADSEGAGASEQSPKPDRPRLTTAQARSDAVVAAMLGKVDDHGTVTYAPREHRRTRLELVIDAPHRRRHRRQPRPVRAGPHLRRHRPDPDGRRRRDRPGPGRRGHRTPARPRPGHLPLDQAAHPHQEARQGHLPLLRAPRDPRRDGPPHRVPARRALSALERVVAVSGVPPAQERRPAHRRGQNRRRSADHHTARHRLLLHATALPRPSRP
jgi:hypothetical protein